jgi:hypothetical protein
MAAPRSDDDSLDLRGLDLDHIDESLLEAPRAGGWRWVGLLALAASAGTLAWLPSTAFYRSQRQGALLFVLCAAATVIGLVAGRFMWRWLEEVGRNAPLARPYAPNPPSAVARVLTFVVATGGALAMLVLVPRAQLAAGTRSGGTGLWFLAAAGAVVIGGLLGRWLLMQQHNPFPEDQPLRLPGWFKWVSLAILVGLGLLALFGMQLLPVHDRATLKFWLGGVAFLVGVLGAIWVARRFDEIEQRKRDER